jgi:hypothetical protein
MGGGLMQLVAYGAQDIYLTGNPQITFFKVVYRRHTNFSMEAIVQTFNGTVGTGSSTVTATISRNGDLVSNLWLDIKLDSTGFASHTTSPTYTQWTNNTGHAFVKECEIEIGGQRIDRHYSQWLDVYNELTDHDEAEWMGLNKHAAKNAYLKSATSATVPVDGLRLYVPLKFWFCRNPGLALPLIALQYHEVKLKLTTRNLTALVNTDGTLEADGFTVAPTCDLWADYIYLDTDERRRFAQVSHEYLIEQVQREVGSASSAITSQTLNFNHPVKELIWVVQDSTAVTERTTAVATADPLLNIADSAFSHGNDYFNYSAATAGTSEVINGLSKKETFDTLRLQLNGHDRFADRNASYFRTCQPIQAGHKVPSKHIYTYSFALKPEEHQPSGTCNFSRIDNAAMLFGSTGTTSAADLTVYAVNYNVLRIMSGMGGLAYSN